MTNEFVIIFPFFFFLRSGKRPICVIDIISFEVILLETTFTRARRTLRKKKKRKKKRAYLWRTLLRFPFSISSDPQPVGIKFLWKLLSYKSACGTVFRVNQFSQWFLLRAENSQPVVDSPSSPASRPDPTYLFVSLFLFLFLGLSMLLWFMPRSRACKFLSL